MSVFITLGTYTNEGAGGLVEGDSDRRAVMETFHSSVGAKLLDYHITRGRSVSYTHLTLPTIYSV